MSKATQTATSFLSAAHDEGFTVVIKQPGVVAVTKNFPKGDKDAFTQCDMAAPSVLGLLGAKGGSMWGTDGGSMGGQVALQNGRFCLNVSGVPLRVSAALSKMLAKS